MNDCLLAIDVGTTAAKVSLYGLDGGLLAAAAERYAPVRPRDGWCEQDPEVWWRSVCVAAARCMREAPQVRVASVGVSGVMNGVVLVDEHGRSVRPALLHADLRSAAQARRLAAQVGLERVRAITGHRPEPYYTSAKLAWLHEVEPDAVRQARWCIQAKDYIRGRLTGAWGQTDPSDASLTGMYDLRAGRWSPDIIASLGIADRLLPRVLASGTISGAVHREAADALPLPVGTPVAIGAGDGACATVGAGAVSPGDTYHYLGGTSWIGSLTPAYVPESAPDLSVFSGATPGSHVLYGTVQAAGSCIDWLLRLAGVGRPTDADLAELERIAAAAPEGAKGLLFLPYLEGERAPIWDPSARGAFVGLTASHGRGEVARAVYEGVALALGSVLDRMREAGAEPATVRLIGGGARSVLWRRILAAVYGRPVAVLERLSEATGAGAAVIAGIAAGLLEGWGAAGRFAPIALVEEPEAELARTYAEMAAIYARLYPALADTFRALAALQRPPAHATQGQ